MASALLGQRIGHWKIGKLIDCGKTALVLHAESVVDDVPSGVIKIFDPEVVERFGPAVQMERIERERSLVGHGHPNLVNILEGGSAEVAGATYFFVVMEFVSGRPLASVLGHLSNDDVIKVIRDVASAAKYLEDRKMVHRDIKPENVMVQGLPVKKAVLMARRGRKASDLLYDGRAATGFTMAARPFRSGRTVSASCPCVRG